VFVHDKLSGMNENMVGSMFIICYSCKESNNFETSC